MSKTEPTDLKEAPARPDLPPTDPIEIDADGVERTFDLDPAADGATVERYPRDSEEDVGKALARYRESAPGRVSWSVARRRGKGEIPYPPDRVARGDCSSLEGAREAVKLIAPWVLASDGG